PEGFDPRLPLPGDGRAEWPGGVLPIPTAVNPARGWLANWNNKPIADYAYIDDKNALGKQHRVLDIEARLSEGLISLEDMRDIPKDIGRLNSLGREARFLKPYLFDALKRVPPKHPLATLAQDILKTWDGSVIADALTSELGEPGHVIFTAWLGH